MKYSSFLLKKKKQVRIEWEKNLAHNFDGKKKLETMFCMSPSCDMHLAVKGKVMAGNFVRKQIWSPRL